MLGALPGHCPWLLEAWGSGVRIPIKDETNWVAIGCKLLLGTLKEGRRGTKSIHAAQYAEMCGTQQNTARFASHDHEGSSLFLQKCEAILQKHGIPMELWTTIVRDKVSQDSHRGGDTTRAIPTHREEELKEGFDSPSLKVKLQTKLYG
uniref:Uncharacterized protein n=1 Tax=Timema poppense TaxID=170557 RepID=A0A7R9HGI3_TIMPO|nr:unnamed protein product [Timema poppensis]